VSEKDATTGQITALLRAVPGEGSPADELWRLVYPELRRRARNLFRGERADHTLSATAVVNEVFLRLANQAEPRAWDDRSHFYAVCSGIMRNVLIDHARSRLSQKRGGGAFKESLDETIFPAAVAANEHGIRQVEMALEKLAQQHERPALVVAMRVFGGLTVDEVATELGVSPRTVKADWVIARMRLKEMMLG